MLNLDKWKNKWLAEANLERLLSVQEELFSLDFRISDIDKEIIKLQDQRQQLIDSKPLLEKESLELVWSLFTSEVAKKIPSHSKTELTVEEAIEQQDSAENLEWWGDWGTNNIEDLWQQQWGVLENQEEVKQEDVVEEKNPDEVPKLPEESKVLTKTLDLKKLQIPKIEVPTKIEAAHMQHTEVLEKLKKRNLWRSEEQNKDNEDVVSFLARFSSWTKEEKIKRFTSAKVDLTVI